MIKRFLIWLLKLGGHDQIGVADCLDIKLIRNGKVIQEYHSGWCHTPTNVGFAVVAGLAGNVDTQVAMTYLAVGVGTTAESAAHTALVTEVTDTGLARAAATVTRVTTTQTNDTLQLYKDWTASGVKVLREIGAFNDSSVGVMLGRKLYDAITTANTDHVQMTYKFKFSA